MFKKLYTTSLLVLALACTKETPNTEPAKAPETPKSAESVAATPSAAPEASSNYKAIAVTDKGSVTGTVRWEGAAVDTLPKLTVDKDQSTCGADKLTPRLVVDAQSKGVANTVVFLKDITQGADLVPKDGVLDQKACEYMPHLQIVPKGSKLQVINSDGVLHNVHAYLEGQTTFNLAMPSAGMQFARELKKPGVLELKCDAGHNWMSGYVFVTEHPYYTLTNAQGNFSIDNIPPGKYTVSLWHEGWAQVENAGVPGFSEPVTQEQTVEVTKDGKATVSFVLK